jgi:hypothetical protein
MYVEEVCIDGFKSYAQRTVVPAFDPLFNAITGLNGSGKSNILDAICFVLGITNLSQARATTSAPASATETFHFCSPLRIRVFPRLRRHATSVFFSFHLVRAADEKTKPHPPSSPASALPRSNPNRPDVYIGSRGFFAGAGVQARPSGRDESLREHRVQQRRPIAVARRVRTLRPHHGDEANSHRRSEQVPD